jgi:hypothetical protein
VSFSERHGYKTARTTIQIESISEELRNSLWSLLQICFWGKVTYTRHLVGGGGCYLSANPAIKTLCEKLWFSYFKKPLDEMGNDWSIIVLSLREHFFGCK